MTTTINDTRDLLRQLIETPHIRPFIFRTRFERTMIRLMNYAQEASRESLYIQAKTCLEKMQRIIDKSNATSDGVLRSHEILSGDIKQLLEVLDG